MARFLDHVHSKAEGDVTFPPIDPKLWREASRTAHRAGPHDEAAFDVTVYVRR